MTYPEFFPENCPPIDAEETNGTFYRLIKEKIKKELNEKHFKSPRENQLKRIWPPSYCECELCAISLIKDPNEIHKQKSILKSKIAAYSSRKIFVAKGNLLSKDGVIKNTPNKEEKIFSHHDWWKNKEVESWQKFHYIDDYDESMEE